MTIATHTSGGVSYLERPGEGPVLLCLHGIGSNGGSFGPMIDHLPADWRVIAWHAPGYITSTPLTKDWPVAADYADVLEGFIDRLGLGRVMLFGHSLGCLTAADYARRAPDRITAMTLACCAIGHGVTPGSDLSEASRKRIDDLETMGAEAFAAARAPRLVFDPANNPDIAAAVTADMARVSMPGYGHAAKMLAAGRLLEDLAGITVPTSVIYGAEDVVTPPENSLRAHAAIPQSCRGDLIKIEGAGHAAYRQCPNEFAAALTRCMTQSTGVSS